MIIIIIIRGNNNNNNNILIPGQFDNILRAMESQFHNEVVVQQKISNLQKGAKRLHFNLDFMNKIEVRSNTVFYQLDCLNNARAQTY